MSLVPLTTTFTPSSSCLASDNIWEIFISTSTAYFLQGPPSTSDCLPSGYEVPSYGDSGLGFTFYFPGICPSGYTAACTSTNGLGPYTVTMQMCCPSSFQCQFSPILEWQTTLGCFNPFTATETITVIASESGTTSTTSASINPSGAVNAYAIAIAIRNPGSSTQSASTTASTTSASPNSTTASPNSTTASPNSTTSPGPAETQSSGLNTTGIAIIGVLGGLLIISVNIILFWIWFRWYKNRRHTRQVGEPSTTLELLN
jgi:hypothetical protein